MRDKGAEIAPFLLVNALLNELKQKPDRLVYQAFFVNRRVRNVLLLTIFATIKKPLQTRQELQTIFLWFSLVQVTRDNTSNII